MDSLFPTFKALFGHRLPRLATWLATPWWPADTLAAKQRSLLRLLAVAAEERLDAADLVNCLTEEQRFFYRQRLRRLARRLASGLPLADALEQTPGALSDQQALAVRFGEQSGLLPTTLADLLDASQQDATKITARLHQVTAYLTAIIATIVLMLMYYCIMIIPSFQSIFYDFELELPRPMQLLISCCIFVERYWYGWLLVGLGLVWLLRSERSRRFFRRQVWSRIVPPVARLRSADLLDLLSITLKSGRPLAGALSTLARYHYDSFIRQKLLFVRNEVEQGADIWTSLATTGLLTPAEAYALECSTSNESRAWSMRQLAQLKRGRVARQIELSVGVLQPLLILALAAVVLFIAVACLSPLVNMVSALA